MGSETPFTRRSVLGSSAVFGALGAGLLLPKEGNVAPVGRKLDLDAGPDSAYAYAKAIGDVDPSAVTYTYMQGEAWGVVPSVESRRLFKIFGLGTTRMGPHEGGGYKKYHKEVVYYADPDTNEVLNTWYNPWLEREVEVSHIKNTPVNDYLTDQPVADKSVYTRELAPFHYIEIGNWIVWQEHTYFIMPNRLPPEKYPLHSTGEKFHAAELTGIMARREDLEADTTSAPTIISWTRFNPWMGFMEMGNRPGFVSYQQHAAKTDGINGIPKHLRVYMEKHDPEYFEPVMTWTEPAQNMESMIDFRNKLEAKRAAKGNG